MRFLQFTDEWSKFAVSELLNTYPTNSLSWDKLSYIEKSKIKNIHYGIIHNGFKSTIINGNNQFIPFVNNSFIPKSYTLLQDGDLILADASEDRKDVGRPVEMINVDNQKIISGLHTIHARNKTNLLINGFKGFYFQSYAMKKQIYKIANGSKIYGISPSSFNELFISVPSKEEQQKIVNLLQTIECRIETQIKIINDLKFLKEGISNLIFKISVIENSNKTLQNFLIEGDKTPVDTKKYRKITIKLNKQGIVYSDLTREMADTRPFYLRHKGELIIGKQNYFNGSIAIVDSQFDSCICSNAIMSFNVKNIDKNFLYYQISNNNYLNSQSYKANGTGQKELSEKEFLKFKVWCPSNELQKLIVYSIKGVDEKMNNEKIILKKYIEQKEYLLNNLFI